MIRKISFIVAIMVGLGGTVGAQTAQEGLTLLNQKDFNGAKKIFASLLKSDPKNAVAHYGMGEYYFYTGKADSAKVFYQSGLDANSSNAYNYVGLGKLNVTANPAAAADYFKDAIKKSKKDAGAIVAIAKFYYEQNPKNLVEARKYLDQALVIDGKNAAAYFLEGQIDISENKASDAAGNFDRAIFFDPNNLDAYVYASQIMATARNLNKAVEYLNNALTVKADYWKAHKALGELYYDNQKYAEAVNSFATYFKNVPEDQDVTHYAYSLFFNKQFDEANNLLQALLKKNPNDYVLLRLLGYISYETKDLVNGRSVMDKYFTIVPADKILDDDYAYYGKMLSASGEDSLAIVNYKLALQKDSTEPELYNEIAKANLKLKKFDEGLQYSEKYLKKKPVISAADYFNLGRNLYIVAQNTDIKTDSLKRLDYLVKADSMFAKVADMSPNSMLGPFWRARSLSGIDSETTQGLAKPYFEQALEIMNKDTAKYKKDIAEAYAYMGVYHLKKEEDALSLDYWKKVLEYNPEHKQAAEILNILENKKK